MATAFNVSVKPSAGDYSSLNAALVANECDLTAAATKVFAITGGITGTMTDNTAVTGLTSGATGTCVHASGTNSQILIKSITGTFQNGEIVYENLGTNYVTLADAGNSPYLNIVISGTWASADTSAVSITGYTANSTNYISISTSGSARNNSGIYSEAGGYYFLKASASGVGLINISGIGYLTIDGLQIYNTFTSGSGSESGIRNSGAGNNTFNIYNCIVRGARYAFRDEGSNTPTWNIRNCLCYTTTVGGFVGLNLGFANIYNCVFATTGTYGIRVNVAASDWQVTAINCYANGTAGSCYIQGASSTITQTTCASSDTTGSIGLQNIAYSTANFNNVTAGSENLSLPSGSALIATGTNESGTFTTDITGATRQSSGAWDIGAFYYASSGPAITKGIMNLKTGWWGDI